MTILKVLEHEYFLVFYGAVGWYLLQWSYDRTKAKNKLPFREWWNGMKDNFLVTVFIAPLVVVFDDEILTMYNNFAEHDIQLGKMIYVCAGPITAFLYKLIGNIGK